MKTQTTTRFIYLLICICFTICISGGCSSARDEAPETDNSKLGYIISEILEETENPDTPEDTEPDNNDSDETDIMPEEALLPAEPEIAVDKPEEDLSNGKTIVIDPGHSRLTNSEKEPIGPGSSEMKARSVSGTKGVSSNVPEYELTLTVSLQLRAELQRRGYQVVMTRETDEIEISNVERTAIANDISADAFIRIHADGSDNAGAQGAMTICQTPRNPFNGGIYTECRNLSKHILDEFIAATGAKKRSIWETDTMTGINWSNVPVTILEMGFMTNAQEDLLLTSADYQQKMVHGIANGLDRFFDLSYND